jgi:hypothetical protein
LGGQQSPPTDFRWNGFVSLTRGVASPSVRSTMRSSGTSFQTCVVRLTGQ